MKILTSLLLITTLTFFSSTVYGQEDDLNEDWKALNSFLNKEYAECISQCRVLIPKQTEGTLKMRTQFILARALMEQREFDEAVSLLSAIDFDASFLTSGIPGLIADCKVEQEKYSEALEFYKKAIHAEWNEGTTPMYLFKAFLCSNELGKYEDGQRFVQSIIEYFPKYSKQIQAEKYIFLSSNEKIELSRPAYPQPQQIGIGTINGKPVSEAKFNYAVYKAKEDAQRYSKQTGASAPLLDEDQVWESFVMRTLRSEQAAKLKIRTGENELMSYLLAKDGYAVQQEFLYTFSNEKGEFMPNLLLERLNELKGENPQIWKETREHYFDKIVFEKYHTLIGMLVFVNSLEVERRLDDQKEYSINYYIEEHSNHGEIELAIPDEYFSEAYRTYANSEKYTHLENKRRVHIVEATVKPSKEDTLELINKLKVLKHNFKNSKDDSLFIISSKSSSKFYSSGPYSTAIPNNHRKARNNRLMTYPNSMSKQFENAAIGDVIGPYIDDQDFGVIAKVIGRTDEEIEARHILIEPSHSEVYAREFLKKVTNENFSELAKKHSYDKGSISQGGELGSFFFADMVPEFATYCADAPVGDIGLVKSQFGYHIVQVTKRGGKHLPRLAMIKIPIQMSDASVNEVQNKLNSIRTLFLSEKEGGNNQDYPSLFEKIAEKKGLYTDVLTIEDNSPRVFDFGSQLLEDHLLQFAFDSNTLDGSVSKVFVDSNKVILVLFERKIESGTIDSSKVYTAAMDEMFSRSTSELMLEHIKERSQEELKRKLMTGTISLDDAQFPDVMNGKSLVGKVIHSYKRDKSESIYVRHDSKAVYVEVISESDANVHESFEEAREVLSSSGQYNFAFSINNFLLKSNTIVDNRQLKRLGVRH